MNREELISGWRKYPNAYELDWEYCAYCGGSLDTGWECVDCGADWVQYAYPQGNPNRHPLADAIHKYVEDTERYEWRGENGKSYDFVGSMVIAELPCHENIKLVDTKIEVQKERLLEKLRDIADQRLIAEDKANKWAWEEAELEKRYNEIHKELEKLGEDDESHD